MKISPPNFSENLGACASKDDEILIYISEKHDNYLAAIDTIIHESVHAFQSLVEYINESDPSSEFAAYTTAHIASTCIEEYTKYLNEQALTMLNDAAKEEGVAE